jgi:hypothetical protein
VSAQPGKQQRSTAQLQARGSLLQAADAETVDSRSCENRSSLSLGDKQKSPIRALADGAFSL